ncbi:MAG: radical SAM protein [Candidatus Omnitrophota bacterium]
MKGTNQDFSVSLLRLPIVSVAGSLSSSAIVPPLSTAYLSAALRNAGFTVSHIDAVGEGIDRVRRISPEENLEYQGLSIEEILQRIPPNTGLLGISCMFSSEWPFAKKIIREIKKERPGIKIAAGGEHITALPEFSLSDCEALDIACLGEGEETISDLARCVYEDTNLEPVNGIIFKRDGVLVKNPPRARLKNVDKLWPDWDAAPINTYLDLKLSFGPYRGRTMPILTSRGCPFNCAFCSNATMWKCVHVRRSPQDVVDEITHYRGKYNIKCVEFYDLEPIFKKDWIMEFCDALIKNNLNIEFQISGGTRFEYIDEEVVAKLKTAGCQYLAFAPESGSPAVLKQIRKTTDIPKMIKLMKSAIRQDMGTRANFVIGFPNDTRWQVYQTLCLIIKLAFMGVKDSPIFEFTPYPGSEYFDLLFKRKIIKLDDEYFASLGLNLQIGNKKKYCAQVGPYELAFYRLIGMLLFYGIYYLLRPLKLLKFIKNMFRYTSSESVFEQRIIFNIKKLQAKAKSRS